MAKVGGAAGAACQAPLRGGFFTASQRRGYFAGSAGFVNLASSTGTLSCTSLIWMVKRPLGRASVQRRGTFAIKNADVSAAMLSDKVRAILDTQAEICNAVDNSCLMHIGGALSRQRAGVRCQIGRAHV